MSHLHLTKVNLLLILILLLAVFSRVLMLGSFPPAMHADEVMNVYVGRYILENGVDLYGNPWPLLYFDNFGDYPNVVPMYISGIFTYLFGVNTFAARFPIAAMGVLGVLMVYLISREIYQKHSAALFAAFYLAIQPWHIIMSRATAEGVTASTVLLASLLLIIKGTKQSKVWMVGISVIPLLLTYFLYPGFRVLTPIVMFPAILLTRDIKIKFTLGCLTLMLFAVTIGISFTSWGTGRFNQTSAFSKQSEAYVFQQEFIAGLGNNNVIFARFLYNKPVMYGKQIIDNYADYFSPSYLFTKGGRPERYAIPNYGLLLISTLVISLFFVPSQLWSKFGVNLKWQAEDFVRNGKKYFYWMIYVLFVSVIPAALTIDDIPNVHRSILMGIVLSILIAYLFSRTSQWKIINVSVWMAIAFFMLLEFIYFGISYSIQAPKYQAVARHADSRKIVDDIVSNQANYNKVFVSVEPANPLYYLFLKSDFSDHYAGKFQRGLKIEDIDNVNFFDNNCPETEIVELMEPEDMLIIHEACYDQIKTNTLIIFKRQFHHYWLQKQVMEK